jgi:hypothetical protein
MQKEYYQLPEEGDILFPVIELVDELWDELEKKLRDETTFGFRCAIIRGR